MLWCRWSCMKSCWRRKVKLQHWKQKLCSWCGIMKKPLAMMTWGSSYSSLVMCLFSWLWMCFGHSIKKLSNSACPADCWMLNAVDLIHCWRRWHCRETVTILFCRWMSVTTEDTAEQYKVELAIEERSAGAQHSLWEDHVVADAEGENGFVVGTCWLQVTSD